MRPEVKQVIDTVSLWDGILAHPHRFGGVEFSLGKVEVGHIHTFGMVDIPFTRKVRSRLVSAGEAEPHHLLHDSGWITFHLRGAADIEQALRLYRLSYLFKRSRRDRTFAEAGERELRSMGFGNVEEAGSGSG
jgi:hypothetical protein